MCTVSLVIPTITNPISPNYIPWTPLTPTPAEASLLWEALRRLEELDRRLGLVECQLQEHDKVAFMRKLKRRADKAKPKRKRDTWTEQRNALHCQARGCDGCAICRPRRKRAKKRGGG